MEEAGFSVYVLRSEQDPEITYIGFTRNLASRLKQHNQGCGSYSKKYRPWSLAFSAWFPVKANALAFEAYLKSHSGKAFARKRLL
ncbi:MAG: GIY-YIG nuclease family protein [Opitutales bacterium]